MFKRSRSRPLVPERAWARACRALGPDFERDLVAAQLDELDGDELVDQAALDVVRSSLLHGAQLGVLVTYDLSLVFAVPDSPIAAKFVSPSGSVMTINRRARFLVRDVRREGNALTVTVETVRSFWYPRVQRYRFHCDAARVALVVPGAGVR